MARQKRTRGKRRGRPRDGARVLGPYKRQDGRFAVLVFTPSGERKTLYASSKKEARLLLRAARDEVDSEVLTVERSLEQYDEYMATRGLRPRTRETTTTGIKAMIGDDDKALARVTGRFLSKRVEERLREGRAVDTVASGMRMLRTWARWCHKQGLFTLRHLEGIEDVEVIGRRRKGKAQLTADEARKFLDAGLRIAAKGPRKKDQVKDKTPITQEGALIATCALVLGVRARELLDRAVRDLDEEGTVLVIWSGKTDAARRRLEVPEVVAELLQAQVKGRAHEDRLFGEKEGQGRPRSTSWLNGQVRALCRAAKVPEVCTHGLRGTHATLAEEAGATGHLVAATLGHTSAAVAGRHYTAPGTREKIAQRRAFKVIAGGRR